MRYVLPGLAMLVLLAVLHTFTLASGIPAELKVEPLTITTASGDVHEFRVHIADTFESRRRGLMFVTRMAADEGISTNILANRLKRLSAVAGRDGSTRMCVSESTLSSVVVA